MIFRSPIIGIEEVLRVGYIALIILLFYYIFS